MTPNRREFFQAAVAAVAVPARVLGANDRINVAVSGIGGRGNDHLRFLAAQQNCRIAAVCDVNQEALERAVATVDKLQGHKPAAFADMRRALDSRDVDAVSIATPNHWHALGTIWACQAGKDVYVEKPACHNVWEGRKMIEAARKYSRIVQVGLQSRSNAHKIRAMKLLRDGVVGDVYMAKGLCFKRRKSIGHQPDGPAPPGLNWDLFLGPAPMRPFNALRYKYNWHWFWDTGNGDIGNQGVHEIDIALWGMGAPGLPKSAVASGGKYAYVDDQETPNTLLAAFDYGSREIVFEVRGLPTGTEGDLDRLGGNVTANLFYGPDGYMEVDPEGFRVYKGEKREKVIDEKRVESEAYATEPHFASFLDAVRARDPKRLAADLETGVAAASLAHLANISYRTRRKLAFDPASWDFPGDTEADSMLTRPYRRPYVVPDTV